MPSQGVTDYINIDDFSPGIYGDWQASNGSQPAPDGSAQITDTWGCVASPSGGLMPAPRSVQTATQSLLDLPEGANRYPVNEARMVVLAFRSLYPVFPTGTGSPKALASQDPNSPDFLDKCFVVWGWYYDSGNTSNFSQKLRARTYKFYNDNSVYDIVSVQSAALGNLSGVGALYGRADIDFTRTRKSDPTLPGGPHAIILASPSRAAVGVGTAVAYPDFDTSSTDSQEAIDIAGIDPNSQIVKLFTHQDRVFGLATFINVFGSTAGTHFSEGFGWSDINNYAGQDGFASFVAEEPSGIALAQSVNASELLIVKNDGGGYVIRGDINQPQVLRLPGIAATGGMADNKGTMSSLGFVYGTRQGVYRWNGGDQSEAISPQLDGDFWIPAPPTPIKYQHAQNLGAFAFRHPYIFAPNSFILDVRTGGWWRLQDPDQRLLSWWQTAWAGRVIGMPVQVDTTAPTAFEWFDPHQGCSEYKWKSQPLRRTIARLYMFREISMVAQGTGRITVTITGLNGETETRDFDFDTPDPTVKRDSLSLDCHDAVVAIHSMAADPANPAPRIHRLHLGYQETKQVARD